MEAAQSRVQREAEKVFENLDKELIRKMQGDMYRCSAKCCDNLTSGMDDTQKCIESCSSSLMKAQSFIQNQVENFQSRLQRCAMDCQDKIRDKASPGMADTQMTQLRQEMEQCVVKCADSHIKLLPDLSKRIRDAVTRNQY